MEIGGYAARIVSHKRPFLVSAFVAQYFLIVVVRPASTPPCLYKTGIMPGRTRLAGLTHTGTSTIHRCHLPIALAGHQGLSTRSITTRHPPKSTLSLSVLSSGIPPSNDLGIGNPS
jgi:hypothetical protein